jgi:hypothetical protein
MRVRLTRRGRLTVTLTVTCLVVAAVGATYAVTKTSVGSVIGLRPTPSCRVDIGDDTLSWTTEQAMTATTVAAVGKRIDATDSAIAAAVARSLRGRDDRVVDANGSRTIYQRLPTAVHPSAQSRAVAAALLGAHGAALTCRLQGLPDSVKNRVPGVVHVEAQGASGLTPRATTVRRAMRETFGRQILGGFAPAGVSNGHVEGSAHYEGRAIDVFFRPINAANQQLGWQQAMWAVAHAEQLQLATIIFDRRIWSAEHGSSGWRDYVYPDGPTENPVLMHEDHVHVDVLRGVDAERPVS